MVLVPIINKSNDILILPDFSQSKLIVVGDVMLDHYWRGVTRRISPEAPVPVVNITDDKTVPGGAANTAMCLSKLGCEVSLYGIVGQDEAANLLGEHLFKVGIHNKLFVDEQFETIKKLRVIDRSLHQQLIRLDFESPPHTVNKSKALDELHQHYCQQISQGDVDAIIVSDYAKQVVLRDPQLFIQPAREAGIPIFVDPKRVDWHAYRGTSLIKPNMKEFIATAGYCVEREDFVLKGLEIIRKEGLEGLLVTRGAEGMLLLQPDVEPVWLEAQSRDVFDVTGAGDMVIAMLAAAYTTGLSFADSVALANLAAGLIVKKSGTATLSVEELKNALNRKKLLFAGAVLSQSDLVNELNSVRAESKRIVFTNGCFDVLHAGHIAYLEQARALGDYLIVGVNDDDSVKRLKGSKRPFNTLSHRLSVLSALRAVDAVIPFSEDTPLQLIKTVSPDVLVKGGDYTIDTIVGADFVSSYGGSVKVLTHIAGLSTTETLKKMRSDA